MSQQIEHKDVTIQCSYRSFNVKICDLSHKMKSLIDQNHTIHTSTIYYAINLIVELLPLKEGDVEDPQTYYCSGDDPDTIDAYIQAVNWDLPIVVKFLKHRILDGSPLTYDIIQAFRETNDPDYPYLLKQYLLLPVTETDLVNTVIEDIIKSYQKLIISSE